MIIVGKGREKGLRTVRMFHKASPWSSPKGEGEQLAGYPVVFEEDGVR